MRIYDGISWPPYWHTTSQVGVPNGTTGEGLTTVTQMFTPVGNQSITFRLYARRLFALDTLVVKNIDFRVEAVKR